MRFQKIDLLRDPTLKKVKSLKATVRIDNQIIQLVDRRYWKSSTFSELGDGKRDSR